MSRTIHGFTIPKSVVTAVDWAEMPKQVGLRALTADEELQAAKVGKFDLTKTRYDAIKRAICQLDGKAVTNAEGVVDVFWEKCGPKVRALLMQGYDKITGTSDEEDNSFLDSVKVTVA